MKNEKWKVKKSITRYSLPVTRYGFTLIEVMIAVAVLVIALVPLLKFLTDSIKTTQFFGDQSKADKLAQELLEEIKGKKWDENSPPDGSPIDLANASNIGIDSGESLSNKLTFDDIDDYNSYQETVLSKFSRKVIVKYYTIPDSGGEMQTAGDGLGSVKTNYKWLQITVSWQADNKQCKVAIESIRSNYRK
ncbi:MAG: prepilin-type N-terminal cleavage/methylation domain-containing protein [Elusimicrobiota bacterium]